MTRDNSADPVVSVLIPAYNVTAYIAETLNSVLAQDFREPYEIIVVNDGCPDSANLEKALQPFRSAIHYVRQENGGPSAARNTAIRAAHAAYVATLDADDAWLPNYLSYQMNVLRSNPDIDLLYPDVELFGDTPLAGRRGMDLAPSEGTATFESLLDQRCTVFQCVTAKREVIERAGLWDPAIRHAEDFDLWLRIAWQGSRIAFHRTILGRHRIWGQSLSADELSMCAGQIYVYQKMARTLPLTAAQRAIVERQTEITAANHSLIQGKQAFLAQDFARARDCIRKANQTLRKRKLSLLTEGLRIAPRAMLAAVRLRSRLNPAYRL